MAFCPRTKKLTLVEKRIRAGDIRAEHNPRIGDQKPVMTELLPENTYW